MLETKMTEMEESEKCQERYQQAEVTVLARFLAEDPDSGRRDYFISRSTLLDVTDLTRRTLRSTDARVARLQGTLVRGLALGRAEVQVVSPLTGHVLGKTEVRVVKQRESVKELRVRVVSGINLEVKPGEEGALVLHTTLGERLTSKYQVQKCPKVTLKFANILYCLPSMHPAPPLNCGDERHCIKFHCIHCICALGVTAHFLS